MDKGYVQIYFGPGKGKTTAALGLALRAIGGGKKVFLAQFIKVRRGGEHQAFARLGGDICVHLYGPGLQNEDSGGLSREAVRRGLAEVREAISSEFYDLVILDEIFAAVDRGYVTTEEVLEILAAKPSAVELVLTGRNADQRVIDQADLATEMREVKHYYQRGVRARRGIEF